VSVLTLEADDTHIVKWYVDAAFEVHVDFISHTGATLTLGSGAISSASTKQKVNTRSSTDAELIVIDDYIAQVVWTKNFLEAQGYGVNDTVIYHDNIYVDNTTRPQWSGKYWEALASPQHQIFLHHRSHSEQSVQCQVLPIR
jgi:hypothetical protein